jgi:hypothetical protein
MLGSVAEIVSGKKTYIIAAAWILYGVLGAVLGDKTFEETMRIIFEGVVAGTLRAGIKKAEVP